jgi:ATP-dependent Lhr-like helicase
VTPEGELVGSLDARFVTSRGASDFALGGTSWQVVKCDDAHSMVVVVPGEAGKSRVFWRGGQSGLSPLLCDAVQRIVSAGKSGLPLSPRDRALLQKAIGEMPAGISRHGLHVWERSSETGKFVLVLSFKGMRFNRILAALLSRELEGKGRVQYHDLAVSVRNAGKGGAERVTAALCRVKALSREEIGNALVLPPRESWKFAGALPEDMFREMVLSDYFGVGGFCTELTRSPISSGEREGSGEGPAEGTDGGNA